MGPSSNRIFFSIRKPTVGITREHCVQRYRAFVRGITASCTRAKLVWSSSTLFATVRVFLTFRMHFVFCFRVLNFLLVP